MGATEIAQAARCKRGNVDKTLGRSAQNLTLGSRSTARIRTDAVFRARLRPRDICACRQIVIGNRSLANLAAAPQGSGSRAAVAVQRRGCLEARAKQGALAQSSHTPNRNCFKRPPRAIWSNNRSRKGGPPRCPIFAMKCVPANVMNITGDRASLLSFDAQLEQRHAFEKRRSMPKAVTDELAILNRADLLVLQYPATWWHLPPAMLKGWFDWVPLGCGAAYTSKKRFERGHKFVGKRAMLSVTVGTELAAPMKQDGRSGCTSTRCSGRSISLWPMSDTMSSPPTSHMASEAGLRYSEPAAVEERLRTIVADFRATLPRIGRRETIAFNRMEEWGPDGRLAPGAPVHSPYIRRRQQLELE